MSNFVKGVAKRFREDRGYGFVTAEPHGDIFVHRNILTESGFAGVPAQGSGVHLEIAETDRGLSATRVVWVEELEHCFPPLAEQVADQGPPLAARVKFFNWKKGFGFIRLFGRTTDYHFSAAVLDAFEHPPSNGEGVAVFLTPAAEVGKGEVVRMIPWHLAEGRVHDRT